MTNVTLWSNVTFYRITGFNTGNQDTEKINSEPKKYFFDADRNILTFKSLSFVLF